MGLRQVNKFIKRYNKTDNVSLQSKYKLHKKKQKGKGKNDNETSLLLNKSKYNPKLTSFDMRREIVYSGIHKHDSTVHRRLFADGRKAIRPKKITFNRSYDEKKIDLRKII